MINENQARKYCKEDISKIENYDKAIADTTQTWACHHRDEIKILPSGMEVRRSKEELIENGRYFDCPANELIFLTRKEHMLLHNKGNKIWLGRHHCESTRKKMSESMKGNKNGLGNKGGGMLGKHHAEETKRKMSESHKGKIFSDEHRRKLCEAWVKRRSFKHLVEK